MDSSVKEKRNPNPRENANFLSVFTFWYSIPTFFKGYKKNIEERDLTETLTEHQSKILREKLEKAWENEVKRATKLKSTPSLQGALFKVFGFEFTLYGFIFILEEGLRLLQCLAVGQLLLYFQKDQTEISKTDAYWYGGAIVVTSLLNVFILHGPLFACNHLGMKIRVACCSLIYKKSLKLSKAALGQTTIGQIVNLLSNDVSRFDTAFVFAHFIWLAPLEIIAGSYMVYAQFGFPALIGILLLTLFIPLQMFLGRRISKLRLKTAIRTDERIRLMNEIISGIQVIKMYAWEKPFSKLVDFVRRQEIESVRNTCYLRAIFVSYMMFTTRLSIFVSIISYVLLGNFITADKVFILTSIYNVLRTPMTFFFPQAVSLIAEARISVERLNKFLLYDETDLAKENLENCKDFGVFIERGCAKWSEKSSDSTLENINLVATPGKILGIIGPVGSGKTSILHAILKELPLTHGNLLVNGVISYASQEPWLFSGSVRQNILFGLPMDKLRYNMVVKTCALETDFKLLPYGDKSLVGDRGVSLSGGQRARINLARAIYKNADIYLLDDPLSAVDTHVGKQLFDNCILNYLKPKTVILITHQLQYLKNVDHLLYLENGRVMAEGCFKDLQELNLDFTKLSEQNSNEQELTEVLKINEEDFVRQTSIRSVDSFNTKEAPKVVEEKSQSLSAGFDVYIQYFKNGGNCCVLVCFFSLFIICQILASLADYYITYWVNIEEEDNATVVTESSFWHFSRETSITIYSVITGFLVVLTLVRSVTYFIVCMRASTSLHNSMFSSITRATMKFFNQNPVGRILNRFSKDMGIIDELLTAAMIDTMQVNLSLIAVLIVVAVISPWLLLPTAILLAIFYCLEQFYMPTSKNLKHLEGSTRSPVYSHLSASLQGLTTIRAFGAQKILEDEFDNHQDLHSSSFFSFLSTSRCFGVYIDLICNIYISAVTMSFLIIGNAFAGNVGFAITQALSLNGWVQMGVRQATEVENYITSVERVLEYNQIEHEKSLESPPEKKPQKSWPEQGRIEFNNVFMKYSAEDPPVLRNLTFEIQGRQKIGIVGRTGAGKSSLINAIFQLSPTEGSIIIDGVDIKNIGLHDLRSKISIIPQEPVLFSGTLRKNLDPFDEFSDEDLWKVLEDVELKDSVSDLVSGLDAVMSEGGSNFSVGQTQLVCLARAVLRNNRILVLDEATANIDPKTDGLIQKTIRVKFSGCTVLTIAHRLHTVMDSDKILVMDAGRMKEFGHGFELLQRKGGIFHGMVQQTGKAMADVLFDVAKQSFDKVKKIS